MDCASIVERLRALENASNRTGMARFAITGGEVLGISIPTLRKIAKEIGPNHELALALWDTRIHEAQLLAAFIEDPKKVDRHQAEKWANEFVSWDICDQVCGFLLDRTPFAYELAHEWVHREPEFVRRAGYVLMAALAVHDKKATDGVFLAFLPEIEAHADDPRNFVKKAVNWALRQIGKRNRSLHPAALEVAERLTQRPEASARWIGTDARRELLAKAATWQ